MLSVETRLFLPLVVVLTATAGAMPYNPGDAVHYAEHWYNGHNPAYGLYEYDCANFVSQCLRAGFGGSFTWLRRFAGGNAVRQVLGCRWPRIAADEHGCIVKAVGLGNWLIYDMHCPCRPVDSDWEKRGTLPTFPHHTGIDSSPIADSRDYPQGVYFLQMQTDNWQAQKKIVLAR